jgi:hypothetical protein
VTFDGTNDTSMMIQYLGQQARLFTRSKNGPLFVKIDTAYAYDSIPVVIWDSNRRHKIGGIGILLFKRLASLFRSVMIS